MATSSGPGPGMQDSWSDQVEKETFRVMDDSPTAPTGGAKTAKKSFASVLGSNIPVRDSKNVLEIVLEKDTKGAFNVTEAECAHLMNKLGLDQKPGVHVEEVQICPQRRGVIFITLKRELEIERFCRYDVLEVSRSGTRAVVVKPAVKREVVVTVRGLHPNTKDTVVVEYLGKFGQVSNSKVVYGVYSDGPLKGFKNGDRSYQMVIKASNYLGSYHYIDNQKVSMRYPGQQQTCARCFQPSKHCRGRGLAKKCEEAGGHRIEFTDYILNLWKTIGYSPESSESEDPANPDTIVQQCGGVFTPKKRPEAGKVAFTGVSIRQFPRNTDHGVIIEFLVNSGLPDSKRDSVTFNNHGGVMIKDLETSECQALIEYIHGKKHFGQIMFCNGYIPLSPEKQLEHEQLATGSQKVEKPLPPQLQTVPQDRPVISLQPPEQELMSSDIVPATGENSQHQERFQSQVDFRGFLSNQEVTRRHSISLIDRTPPPKSLAAEILGRSTSLTAAKSLLTEIADLQDSLSEFNSCKSSSSCSSSSSDEGGDDLKDNSKVNSKTLNAKKREKKRKRKAAQTPTKEEFLTKKLNTQKSPK